MIPCPECMKLISNTVENCPKCGYKLTLEDVAKVKKRRQEWKISFIIMGATVIIGILVIGAVVISTELEQSRIRSNYQKRTKNPTGTSTYSSQPQRPKTTETQLPSGSVMSASKPSAPPETETQQEQTTGNEAWLGTWSLDFIGGQSTEENLAGSLQSDIFLSWNYTFYADGRFESKLRQDTGKGILTTTTYGTYEVSGNRYNTVLKEAPMSIGSTSVPIPDITSYQSGTWSRTGDMLTMIPVGSSTKVFKLLEVLQTISLAHVSAHYDQKLDSLKQVVPEYPDDAREKPQTTPPAEVSTEYDEMPRLLKQVFTRYPEAARRAERAGLVTLEFTASVAGRATDINVVKEEPKGFGFGEASIEAVKKMRFTPAKKDGENVPMRVRLPIRFILEL